MQVRFTLRIRIVNNGDDNDNLLWWYLIVHLCCQEKVANV